jgi:hypothetical protein
VILEMMIAIITLMYVISLALQLPACITVQNQCLNAKLLSPVYFGNCVVCPKLFGQQIEIGIGTSARFEI